ncbi:hypothetical protein [Thalassospira sp. TSL5-1]|uniref:hypothetical protein n=1 Tax=Thalassospira sp. TSL5-1 TaxID=1544451 RepID=UPI00116143C7|nr:hypothetical protein [Thalassospira sp. TSL5-1]
MSSMNISPEIEGRLKNLLAHFNVNVAMSHKVAKHLTPLPASEKEALRQEFKLRLKENLLGAAEFRRFTACSARDEKTARQFFRDVYAYAFEDGEEPDVADY